MHAATPELSPPTEQTFKADFDGSTQKYMQRLPQDFDPKVAHPLLIGLHGHGADRRQYTSDPRGECGGARDVAAKHGMIFVAPDYRGPSWMGPAAEADVVQLIRELKKQFKISKVYLTGASMGGTAALIFAALHPELLNGVSSQNGIASLMEYDQAAAGIAPAIKTSYGGRADETLAQYRQRAPAEFQKRSAVLHAEEFTMPLAITVGEQDTIVPPQTTIQLAHAVERFNRNVLLIARPKGGHVTDYADTVAAVEFIVSRP